MDNATMRTIESTKDVLERLGIKVHSETGRKRFREHVKVHKYFIDRERDDDTEWREAVASWINNVAEPLLGAVQQDHVKSSFPGKRFDGLFFEVSDHWHFLKIERPEVTPNEAAERFAREYGNPFARFLGGYVFGPLKRWMSQDAIRGETIERNISRYRHFDF